MSPRRRTVALGAGTALVAVSVLVVVTVTGRTGRSQASPNAAVSTTGARPAQSARTSTTRHDPSTSSRSIAPTTTAATIASTTVTTAPAGPPWSVQHTTVEFYDPTRTSPARDTSPAHSGRTLRTTLRWPVLPNGRVAPGPLPLIVFGHGYNVSAATYSALLDDLTRAGMVVAAPDFPGESTAYPGPAVESDLVNEPCDMEFVAAALEHHPPAALRATLPGAPLIVAGHSDGATAAAWAGYASTCSAVPIRAVIALSPDDVPMTGAFRFGTPPPLLAMSGTADEVNPLAHTLTLYGHVPPPAWLVTIDGGSHLGTFTTDPDRVRVDAMIADFVSMVAGHDHGGRQRLVQGAIGRIHLQSR